MPFREPNCGVICLFFLTREILRLLLRDLAPSVIQVLIPSLCGQQSLVGAVPLLREPRSKHFTAQPFLTGRVSSADII